MQREQESGTGFEQAMTALVQRLGQSIPLSIGILLFGAVLRTAPYLANRSFWHDEANIALDVMSRSVTNLFGPSALYEQTAPVGWLISERVIGILFGFSEQALRAWPFVASLAALPLCFIVAKRLLPPLGVQVTIGLLAIAEPAIHYATEVKPYSSDITVTLLIYLLGLQLLVQQPRRAWLGAAAMAGALSIWFSHVAIFGLAAVGITLATLHIASRNYKSLSREIPVYAAWGGSFLVCYLVYIGKISSDQELLAFWDRAAGYMPFPPTSIADFFWYIHTFMSLPHTLGLETVALAAFVCVVGAGAMAKQNLRFLSLLSLPVLLAFAASAFGGYAFNERLILFAAPCMALLIGSGVSFLFGRTRVSGGWLTCCLLIFLVASPFVGAVRNLLHPVQIADVRSALEYITENASETDTIYLSSGTLKPYLYYSRRGHFSREVMINGNRHGHAHFNWARVNEDLEELSRRDRVWVVFSGVWRSEDKNEEDTFLQAARNLGEVQLHREFAGANVYLFDFSKSSRIKNEE